MCLATCVISELRHPALMGDRSPRTFIVASPADDGKDGRHLALQRVPLTEITPSSRRWSALPKHNNGSPARGGAPVSSRWGPRHATQKPIPPGSAPRGDAETDTARDGRGCA